MSDPLVRPVMERLEGDRASLAATYRAARPYPHLAIDGLFNDAVLDAVAAEFPEPGARDWIEWDTEHERKSTSRGLAGLGHTTRALLRRLCDRDVVAALEVVTGLRDLVGDPTFFGAGLQDSPNGGWLDVHSDYTGHPGGLRLVRRLNLLVYLNRGWAPEWGGDLELWDRATETCSARYAPTFNRTVLFPTTVDALHGHPVPNAGPPSRSRRLVSVYYWSPAALSPPAEPIRWYGRSDAAWDARARAVAELVETAVPPTERVALVDDGALGAGWFPPGRTVPVIERAGAYWGPPTDDGQAVAELDRLAARGVRHLVVTWPAAWWLEHYRGLAARLEASAVIVAQTPDAVVYRLDAPPGR
ncbi:MAG: 2OG-Fe(II) oxygenase [Acidimicrobiia bacterium]|nr:2OG-Fe(II) oxygenase [Acidimicrobiia bacterium]